MSRCIRKPIEFFVQSNEFRFVGRSAIKLNWHTEYSFGKTEPGKAKPYKLSASGMLFRGDTIKQLRRRFKNNRQFSETLKKYQDIFLKQEAVQEITIVHIDSEGFYALDDGPERWPNRMYLKIPIGLSTEDATDYLIKKYGFCDFLHGVDFPETINHLEDDPYLEIMTPTNGVRAINWLHLYRKILWLTDIIQNVKNVTQKDRAFLLEEVRNNVIEIRVSMDDPAYKEIRDFDAGRGTDGNEDTPFSLPGDREWWRGMKGYRVYGHIALCCLELLTDIERGHFERFCEYTLCRKQLPYGSHGNKRTCDDECAKKHHSEQRKGDRAEDKKTKDTMA